MIMEKSSDLIPIYTIGYGSRSIAELIEVLHQHEIAYLIDVRSAPYSRYKPEFSKAPLANQLEQHDIRYVYMGDTLGGRPDDETCYVNGKVDYEKVKVTEFYQRGIQRLHTAFLSNNNLLSSCAAKGNRRRVTDASLSGQRSQHRISPSFISTKTTSK